MISAASCLRQAFDETLPWYTHVHMPQSRDAM